MPDNINTVRFDIKWRNEVEVSKKGIRGYTENFLRAISEKKDSDIYTYPYPQVMKTVAYDNNVVTIEIEDSSALYKNLEHGIEVISILKKYPEQISEILIHQTRWSDNTKYLYREVCEYNHPVYIEIKEMPEAEYRRELVRY